MDDFNHISSFQLDMLKEIGNIGAGHAATSLSELLNRTIDMKVPAVRIVALHEVTEMFGDAEEPVASVLLRIEGDAPGSMFFMLSLPEAAVIVRHLTGENSFSFEQPPYPEMALSALQEVGNILVGSYLSSLSDFTNLNMQPSPPSISVDMAGAIMGSGLIELSQFGDYAILIDTVLSEITDHSVKEVEGRLFFIPDPGSFEKVSALLGAPIDE